MCKYNLNIEDALIRGWCKTCNTFECVKIKDENTHCHKCDNTGISDCKGEKVTICDNCIWGRYFAIEQNEWQKVGIEGLEQMMALE